MASSSRYFSLDGHSRSGPLAGADGRIWVLPGQQRRLSMLMPITRPATLPRAPAPGDRGCISGQLGARRPRATGSLLALAGDPALIDLLLRTLATELATTTPALTTNVGRGQGPSCGHRRPGADRGCRRHRGRSGPRGCRRRSHRWNSDGLAFARHWAGGRLRNVGTGWTPTVVVTGPEKQFRGWPGRSSSASWLGSPVVWRWRWRSESYGGPSRRQPHSSMLEGGTASGALGLDLAAPGIA